VIGYAVLPDLHKPGDLQHGTKQLEKRTDRGEMDVCRHLNIVSTTRTGLILQQPHCVNLQFPDLFTIDPRIEASHHSVTIDKDKFCAVSHCDGRFDRGCIPELRKSGCIDFVALG